MRKALSPFKLGLFVLAGAAIVVGGLLWIGVARYFHAERTYVTFFDHSIRGLHTGASIDHLGISVGRVARISLAQDGRLARVVMSIDSSFQVGQSEAIEMKMAGIAGGHYLAIVQAPQNLEKVTPKLNFQTKYPLIPSIPGTLTDIESALESTFTKLQKIDFQGLLASMEKISHSAENILSNKEIQGTLKNLNETSAALKRLLAGVSGPETVKALRSGMEDFAAASSSARKAAKSLNTQIGGVPPNSFADFAKRMNKTASKAEKLVSTMGRQIDASLNLFQQSIQQLNQALSDLKGLAQTLREEPGQILERPKGGQPFGR